MTSPSSLRTPGRLLAATLALALSASGQTIFTANFDDFTAPDGNFNGGQFESNLAVAHTGNLPDWSKSGAGTVHAVDHANLFPDIVAPRNFAVMLWQDNVITQATAIVGSNDSGVTYQVEFSASPAVYQAPNQQTAAGDSFVVEVLRADDSVLATHTHEPGAWAGTIDLVADSFQYTGDGSGDIRLRIGPTPPLNAGRFAGAVDDVSVSLVPPPALFSENFNGFTDGNFNGGQFESELAVAFGGNLPGWTKSGAGAVHIVDTANVHPDTSNPRDIAVMFWQDNVITLADAITGSNDSGAEYLVEFEASPAVYQAPSQVTTETDGILVEVLRDDGTVLASHTHEPGAWAGDVALLTDSFTYTGDGSGDIRLRFGPSAFGSGHFGGALDNVALSVAGASGPQIASFTANPELLANAGDPLTLNWEVGLPLDSLTLEPGGFDLLPNTDDAGVGSRTLDPGPEADTTFTLTAMRGGNAVVREVNVSILPPPGSPLFNADFNDFAGGNFNGAQFESGLDLAFGGDLPAWTKSGGGVVHAMDHANQTGDIVNPRDFAVMIWQDNVITLRDPIADSNVDGIEYLVEFEASPAVYQAGNQQTSDTDGLLIELLRSDGSVLADYIHQPGAWTGPPVLMPDSFTYVGDGSGALTLRIGPSAFGSGRFGGAIDNVALSVPNPLGPKITSFTATPNPLTDAGEAVTFEWEVEVPLDSLVLNPGEIDALAGTDENGIGSHILDPGPDGTTEFSLTATRNGESVSRILNLTLPPPTINSFAVSPVPSAPGQALTLSWEAELPVTTLTINPGAIDVSGDTDDAGVGSILLDPGPAETTAYTLTASRGTSTSTANATARVAIPPNPNAVFFDNFDDFTGGSFNGAQFESGLDLAHSGTLPGWQGSGQNDVHAADLANETGNVVNPRNFAVMIWQDNVITQIEPIPGSNQAGTKYLVQFDAAPAVYQAGSQQTGPDDGLLIELLRDDDSVLADFIYQPGAWNGFPELLPASFEYVGDGTGDLRFRVGPAAFGSGRFGGLIDNLTLAPATLPRLRITDISLNPIISELTISWESADGKLYNLRSEVDPSAAEPTDWPIFGDHADIEATAPENTLIVRPVPIDLQRFFVIEEFNAPPQSILADDFESGQGNWTIGSDGAAGTAWELGTPSNVGPAAANSADHCFGTNLSDDYTIDANVWLRSPPIDLTTAGGATLNYAQFFDIEEGFDLGRVSVLDSSDDSVLAVIEDNLDGVSADWTQVSKTLPPEALGKSIVIEFRLLTDDVGNFAGWYIDDFNLTVP